MTNLTNAVYEFAVEQVNAATSQNALYEVDVHESDAEPIHDDLRKLIRVGSSESQPRPVGQKVVEKNGSLTVEFLAKPDSETLADRADARETAHLMCTEMALALFNDERMGGRVCDVQVTGKADGFRNIKTSRYQVSTLSLIFNTL